MKKTILSKITSLLLGMMVVCFFSSCSDEDNDKATDKTLGIEDLLKISNTDFKVGKSGEGNLLDDYLGLIASASAASKTNDEESEKILESYLKRFEEIKDYCEHKSDSVKEADPELYDHLLDSLETVNQEKGLKSIVAGIGQIFGTYGWAELHYMDVGADGKTRMMSTLVIFPTNLFCDLNADHVILCPHWTIASDDERPTNYSEANHMDYKAENSNVMAGEWAAFDEYLVIMPDYEGYGVSKDVSHPYLIREVQARQCIVALMKGIGWFTSDTSLWPGDGHDEEIDDDYKIVIEGFSQGGAVSAATYRYYLEHRNESWAKKLPIAGAVCGDGPHDPYATLKYYCKTNFVEMPVAPAMVLKGLCDYDPEMIAAKCTPSDFCRPGFINSGIFEAIESKKYNTDQCNDIVYNYAKSHPNEIQLKGGHLTADQMLTDAAYNYFYNGKLIKGADYQKLALLKKCLEKNSVAYNFTPPSDAHFTFFHSDGDRVVPYDNYLSMKNAWGTNRLLGVTYTGKGKSSHVEMGTIFFKSYHDDYVDDIIDGDWKSGEKSVD